MHIQIVTAGTYGSVAPYTGLGHRLRDEGHEVEIVTHERFRDAVACCGLKVRALSADPFEQLLAAHRRVTGSGRSPAALYTLARATERAAVALVDGILAAVHDKTEMLLLSTIAAPIGTVVAEYHGIASMGVFLQPEEPTTAFPPCVLGGPRAPGRANLTRGRAVNLVLDGLYAAANRRLHTLLGLPRRGTRALRRSRAGSGWPVWHGFSPAVVPRPADWREGLHVAGYWWPHQCPRWSPPAELADFLEAGPAPVFVGFGSMMPGDAEQLSATAARALRLAGLRGVVQSGWAGLEVADDDVLTVGAVPHHWLFPRTAAVVHHAGAGTTAAGLRAGVPAVPVPVLTDQPWWAARLVSLGASPGALPYGRLTAPRLARLLTRATQEPAHRRRAAALAAVLAGEDGAGRVARAVAAQAR
ncbi:glycosyltransferase [Streptomyces capparidis]